MVKKEGQQKRGLKFGTEGNSDGGGVTKVKVK